MCHSPPPDIDQVRACSDGYRQEEIHPFLVKTYPSMVRGGVKTKEGSLLSDLLVKSSTADALPTE